MQFFVFFSKVFIGKKLSASSLLCWGILLLFSCVLFSVSIFLWVVRYYTLCHEIKVSIPPYSLHCKNSTLKWTLFCRSEALLTFIRTVVHNMVLFRFGPVISTLFMDTGFSLVPRSMWDLLWHHYFCCLYILTISKTSVSFTPTDDRNVTD